MTEEAGRAAATQRLFFALWPDAPLAVALAAMADAAARRYGGRPTRPDTVHLTLAFLGNVAVPDIPLLIDAARRLRAAPFELHIDRLDCWHYNHLLWAGCAPCAALDQLAADLQRVLVEAGHAPAADVPAFMPHLSLVRKLPAVIVAPPPGELSPVALPPWRCTRFLLVASRLSAAGPGYATVGEFPLGG